MIIAIIPDVHGSHHWEKIIPIQDQFDKIIFFGDYFDAWKNEWPDQILNFCKILKLRKENPKVDILWGNHETSYFLSEHCSGYQPIHDIDIFNILKKNQFHLRASAIYDGFIFSHAGISKEWMKCAGIQNPEEINNLFMEHPNYFRWVGPDGYGDNLNESPLWIRIPSLLKTAIENYDQVVGHSENIKLQWIKSKQNTNILCIDSREHSNLIRLDTQTKQFNLL
jgi:hypothetical protein